MRYLVILALVPSIAFAQPQQPDPEFLQRTVQALQQQRNTALDGSAAAVAQVLMMQDAIAKMKAQIADLEKKLTEKKE